MRQKFRSSRLRQSSTRQKIWRICRFEQMESRQLLAAMSLQAEGIPTQIVSGILGLESVLPGQTFSFPVKYATSTGDNTLTGLGLRIHYDSQTLSLVELSDILPTGYIMQQGPVEDAGNYDNDAGTDQYILISWADIDGQWPGADLPSELVTLTFTVSPSAAVGSGSVIRFSSVSTASGYVFDSEPVVVTAAAPEATVTLNHASPKTNDTLTATATKSSVSGAPVSLEFVWRVDGVIKRNVIATTELIDTFDLSLAGNGDKGDTITVEVIPVESTISGTPASAMATVVNTPPAATVRLSTALPSTDEVLIATATKSDADSDPVSLTYVWTVDGVVKRTFTSATAVTDTFDLGLADNGDEGSVVSVKVMPHDGTADGTAVRASATVVDTPPGETPNTNATTPKANPILATVPKTASAGGDAPQQRGTRHGSSYGLSFLKKPIFGLYTYLSGGYNKEHVQQVKNLQQMVIAQRAISVGNRGGYVFEDREQLLSAMLDLAIPVIETTELGEPAPPSPPSQLPVGTPESLTPPTPPTPRKTVVAEESEPEADSNHVLPIAVGSLGLFGFIWFWMIWQRTRRVADPTQVASRRDGWWRSLFKSAGRKDKP